MENIFLLMEIQSELVDPCRDRRNDNPCFRSSLEDSVAQLETQIVRYQSSKEEYNVYIGYLNRE